jgi:hypothetical protein
MVRSARNETIQPPVYGCGPLSGAVRLFRVLGGGGFLVRLARHNGDGIDQRDGPIRVAASSKSQEIRCLAQLGPPAPKAVLSPLCARSQPAGERGAAAA